MILMVNFEGRMGIFTSVLSFPISCTVRLITVLSKRVLGRKKKKAQLDCFVSRVNKFGTCPAIMGGF